MDDDNPSIGTDHATTVPEQARDDEVHIVLSDDGLHGAITSDDEVALTERIEEFLYRSPNFDPEEVDVRIEYDREEA